MTNFEHLNELYVEQYTSTSYKIQVTLTEIQNRIEEYQGYLDEIAAGIVSGMPDLSHIDIKAVISYSYTDQYGFDYLAMAYAREVAYAAAAASNSDDEITVPVTLTTVDSTGQTRVSQEDLPISIIIEGLRTNLDTLKVSYASLVASLSPLNSVTDFSTYFKSLLTTTGVAITDKISALKDAIISIVTQSSDDSTASLFSKLLDFFGLTTAIQRESLNVDPDFADIAVNVPVADYTGVNPFVTFYSSTIATIADLIPDNFFAKAGAVVLAAAIKLVTATIRVAATPFVAYGKFVLAAYEWCTDTFDTDSLTSATDVPDDPSVAIGGNVYSFHETDFAYTLLSQQQGGAGFLRELLSNNGKLFTTVILGATLYAWAALDSNMKWTYYFMIRKHVLNPRVANHLFSNLPISEAATVEDVEDLWDRWFNVGPKFSNYILTSDVLRQELLTAHGWEARMLCAKSIWSVERILPYVLASVRGPSYLAQFCIEDPADVPSFVTNVYDEELPISTYDSARMLDSVTRPLEYDAAILLGRVLIDIYNDTSSIPYAWTSKFLSGSFTVSSDKVEYDTFKDRMAAVLAIAAIIAITVKAAPVVWRFARTLNASTVSAYARFMAIAADPSSSISDVNRSYFKYKLLSLLSGVTPAALSVGGYALTNGIKEAIDGDQDDVLTILTDMQDNIGHKA